jgi:hypothetical protein
MGVSEEEMIMVKGFVTACTLAAVMCAAGTPAAAMTFDKQTRFTFSQPVALPGITLPAGTYVFRLAAPYTERKVIQVTDSAGRESYAMLLTVPTTRYNRPLDTEIQFMETGAGMPAAVKAWFYVGETIGYEFIYPKDQVRRLVAGLPPEPAAVALNEAVATETPATPEAAVTSETGAVAPPAVDEAEVTVEERVGAAASLKAAQQPAPAPVTTDEPAPGSTAAARDELPRTAGPVPLALMFGMATLLGGWWLSRKS